MKTTELKRALNCAVDAARIAGQIMIRGARGPKKISAETQHDIKLELDVRAQQAIEKRLLADFPNIAILGEEGVTGDPAADYRWVVDPIDGTVNFNYGIPHACVSVALQARNPKSKTPADGYDTLVGAVYDPFVDELWTAIRGQPARLNGKIIRVSRRKKLGEAVVAMGFAKSREMLDETLPYFNKLIWKIRKVRIMGAAALAMTYVATGRFDAYVERNVRLWDVAAGGLILECAGGEFWRESSGPGYAYRIIANNGMLRRSLESVR